MQNEYSISDLARIFPDMPPEDFARLVASIREDGLMDPITVWRGQVIDGRHRYAACAEAGVERRFEYLDDDADPLRHILARNDLRRHLDESRRAVVAHKLSASSAPGRPRKENGANLHSSFTQGEAAAWHWGSGPQYVQIGVATWRNAYTPEVKRGSLSLLRKNPLRLRTSCRR